jgi:hypothetical protein
VCSNVDQSLKKYHNFTVFYGALVGFGFMVVNVQNLRSGSRVLVSVNLCSLEFLTSKKFCTTFKNLLLIFTNVDRAIRHKILNFDVCLSVHRRYTRRRKPTRCYSMVYWTCNLLYMFRALICPSSGARDYTCSYNMWRVVPWLLVVGGQVQGSRLCVRDEGVEQHPSSRTHSLLPCTCLPTTSNQSTTRHML